MTSGVRQFHAMDRQGVIELWEEVFADDPPWNTPADVIRTKEAIQPELFFVYELEDRVVGTVLAGFDGVRGWIHKLAVSPQHRGKGYGLELMRCAEQALATAGCPKVNLQVRASNQCVIDFYRRAGYDIEDRVSFGRRL